jgi:hypothetical protein
MNGMSSCAAALLALLCLYPAPGQTPSTAAVLPDAPSVLIQAAPTATENTAQVHGIVRDARGNPVPNAQVTLTAPGKLGDRTTTSAGDGSFAFIDLPPGSYRLTVVATGFDVYTTDEFPVRAGEDFAAINPALSISSTTTVNVVATSQQIAVAQIHEQEKQRVLGVFPNFYTSYIWNAQPMSASQKYKLAARALIDPVQLLTVAGTAGAEQIGNVYPGYGSGIDGYGKRFGAAMATSATSRLVGSAILPSLFRQDPRYFYQGSGGTRSRTAHAVGFVFFCRGDNGKNQLCTSHLLGSLAAAGVANAYLPASSRGIGLTFQTFGIDLAANAAGNLFREFLLRKLESIPRFANGKH